MPATEQHPVGAQDLPGLALSRPNFALAEARRVLALSPDPESASYAHQAAGIVLRERGQLSAAIGELRAAIRSAQRAASVPRLVDVRATLGVTLSMMGKTKLGLAELDAAVAASHGELLSRVRLRRANVLGLLGRHTEALADLGMALTAVRRAGDVLWEARILNNRAVVLLAVGKIASADADATRAGELFDKVEQSLESTDALHNRGVAAARRGDLPTALRMFDASERRYRDLDIDEPDLYVDRGNALLAAGLATEAVSAVMLALQSDAWQPVKRAELLLFAAKAGLADGQFEKARDWAMAAARFFRAQQRSSWQLRAEFLICQARYLSGDRSARLLNAAGSLAPKLDKLRAEETPLAYLLAGRLAQDRNNTALAAEMLSAAGRYRRNGPPLTRATAWLASAMLAESRGTAGQLARACTRGLDALDEHRLAFGAAELRAVATSHGRDLAALAIDSSTSPRAMLAWIERSRSSSLADPAVRMASDPRLEQSLAALRDSSNRINPDALPGDRARKEQAAHEAAVRSRRQQLAGSSTAGTKFDVGALLAALTDTQLLVLVQSRGELCAIHGVDGRLRRYRIGPMADAMKEVEYARFALRRAAHARKTGQRPAATTQAAAGRLQQALLGPLTTKLRPGPLVIIPPAVLQAAPWAALPALAARPLSLAPSARMWLRSKSVPEADGRTALIVGPGLASAGAEIAALSRIYPDAAVLGASSHGLQAAGTDAVLAAMSGANVAHIAAHGNFRADSPMFSSLLLDEGALFVHDLDRLTKPPARVVLSSCDSGVSAPVGADDLLGMVSGLLGIGTAGVLASVVPVNDKAAVPFMIAVHQALAAGNSLAHAASAARLAAEDDSLAQATAASFTVWGV